MKINHLKSFNWEGALRGMRNPLNSWDKADTSYDNFGNAVIGPNDMKLCLKLIKAGSEHRKFLRQIMVSFDLTAPLYVWKEVDTYKVGTVANSTSTMHKIMDHEFTFDDFEMDDFENVPMASGSMFQYDIKEIWNDLILDLNALRNWYLETKDKRYWKELIRILPESFLQTRTMTMNYENILNILHQRENHKLTEWHFICDELMELPYLKEFYDATKKDRESTEQ